jgi:nucleoside-diphosphate-sugar epimerase
MTSGPTVGMLAAARGESFEIPYGGVAQYDYAPAVAQAFVRGSASPAGAVVANFPGVAASMADVAASIEAAAREPGVRITWQEAPLPFPAELEARALEQALGPLARPSLDEGVRETMERFRAAGPSRGSERSG